MKHFGVIHLKISQISNELIESCKRNNRQAQEALYRFFFPKMLPYIKSFTEDEDEIVSIFNDGMLKVFSKIDTYAGTGDFESWVFIILRNKLYNFYRLNNQKAEILELEEVQVVQNPGILRKMYYDDIIKLLKSLPEQSSKVFRMYILEGYSHKEIAEILGISIGTSKWHVFNAREKLSSLIELNIVKYG